MKKLLLLFLVLGQFAYGQDTLKVSVGELSNIMAKSKGAHLPKTAISNTTDVVSSYLIDKGTKQTTVKLGKFGGAVLSLTQDAKGFRGRIIKDTTLYLELEKFGFNGYRFIEHYAGDLIQDLIAPTEPAAPFALTLHHYTDGERAAQRAQDSINIVDKAYNCIWLNFDGGTLTYSSWTISGPITYAPVRFSTNADTCDFVVDYTRESFANVTMVVTRDSNVFKLAHRGKRITINVTPTCAWYGCGVGGVSFIGSMTWADDTPSWVFDVNNNVPIKNIADVPAHESGHQLGLGHQAVYSGEVFVNEYNSGYGSGETGFAPIMGVPYSKNMAIWWNGPRSNSGQMQDDIALMLNPLDSMSLTPDNEGNRWQTAKLMESGFSRMVLLNSNDSDYYKITLSEPATVSLAATPLNFGPSNLYGRVDLKLSLYDHRRQLITTTTATTVLNASLSQALNAGVYYIKVVADYSNPNNPTGYGFAGHYTMTYSHD